MLFEMGVAHVIQQKIVCSDGTPMSGDFHTELIFHSFLSRCIGMGVLSEITVLIHQ